MGSTNSSLTMLRLLLLSGALVAYVNGFCFHNGGGIGEYHWECSQSIEMEACYARCNCWTDFPDMGGQITHEVDAWCFQDACWCSYNQDTCPFGTLKTDPWCCTKNGFTCDEWTCDTDGNCEHTPKEKPKDLFMRLLRK